MSIKIFDDDILLNIYLVYIEIYNKLKFILIFKMNKNNIEI